MSRRFGFAQPIIIIALIALIVGEQTWFDRARTNHLRNVRVPYNELIEPDLPSASSLEHFSSGLNTVLADVLWLVTIQYYGGGDPYGMYRQLPNLVESIITLDKRFLYPYTFAGIVLPNEGFSDQALQILKQGEKALPNEWTLPYYEATIYYINKKDNKLAAESYQRASQKPGAPDNTKFLSAIEFSKADDLNTAIAIFTNLAKTSSNSYFKQRSQLYVDHYTLLRDLNTAIQAFHKNENRYPNSLQELVTKNYITEVPADPLNRVLDYNNQTGSLTADVTK